LLVLLALALVAATAAVTYALVDGSSTSDTLRGSGVETSESRTVADFDSVELVGSNNVTITVGEEEQSVRVYADDNLVERVTTTVSAGALVVGNAPGSFTSRSPMKVEIGLPALSAVTLSGSGNVTVSGVDEPRLTVTLSGSGNVFADGSTDALDVTVSGSGQAQLDSLVARDVDAVVSGSGVIVVTATESLDASVPGDGAILYGGGPAAVTTTVSGTGAITPR
jgi:hypothetical protein